MDYGFNMTNHDLELRLVVVDEKYYTPGLNFTLINNDTEYEVSKGSIGDVTEVVIPKYYLGKPVTMIGYEAFEGCSSLRTVTLGNSIISIGDSAFAYCSSLEKITVDVNNSIYDSRE